MVPDLCIILCPGPVGYNNGFLVFAFFESRIRPTALPEAPPPGGLVAFYWHFIRQTRGLYAAMFATGLCVALVDTAIPVFIGKLVTLMSADDRAAAFHTALPMLIGMAVLILVGRPLTLLADSLVRNNAVVPGVTSLIRWQSHWHVVRQSWPFFQNDFAGRIANRVMQTSNSLRESVVSSIRGIWYITIYGLSALVLMAIADWRLAIPPSSGSRATSFACAISCRACATSPRPPRRSARTSWGASSTATPISSRSSCSRAPATRTPMCARCSRSTRPPCRPTRGSSRSSWPTLATMNALLLVATAGIGITLWGHGLVSAGVVATALPLAWQIANVAGWVSWEVTGIFENIGVVQEGMETIAVPHVLVDAPGARELHVAQGEIRFTNVTFTYGRNDGRKVLDDLDLVVRPGERVGLVGRSGAGKSTLVNLLLRFHELEQGSIRIDGEDIRSVTQESLRAAIGMVTQDTSLLHRSIAANIGYGRPGATNAEIESAARRAHAHEFILDLMDWRMRTGYEAHVGERGVKLSGGQRQRIAIARVILKNAPILVLDEATSALDSEVELAIQDQLLGLMEGKTVIAIAHRLSTIARMDRLIVLDQGRVVEEGTHDVLLRQGGHYALLWKHQSGGFLPHNIPEEEEALIDDGPVDEMRAEEQPEPSMNDDPLPSVTRT
jgi:ATP-binding cassette subfamily B multidrug efflux pump